MKKPAKNTGGPSPFAACPDDVLDAWPILTEMLTATSYEGDPAGSRQTATLLIFAQDGTWRAVLRDRQEGRCLWVSSGTARELLDVLENALGSDGAVWRDDRVGGADTAKRQTPPKKT